MCPACIASTAVMVAGAGSAGGILALCMGKFKNFFRADRFGLFQKTKEKLRWQQAKRETRSTEKGILR
jgi:malic enzyme